MNGKKKPSALEDLKPNPDVAVSQQDEVRGGFIGTEHGAIGAADAAARARARAERSGPGTP